MCHGQVAKTHVAYAFGQVGRASQLADGLLDGDLPERDGAQVDVGLVAQAVQNPVVERRLAGERPQDDVRVEQEPHGAIPKVPAISALVSAESQSSVRSNCPAREPMAVRLTRRLSGMIFATGTPARSMMTSSPLSTRSMMRERCVLASCML